MGEYSCNFDMDKVCIIDESQMTPALDRAIRDGLCACFPADVSTFSRTRAWHESGPSYTVVIEDGSPSPCPLPGVPRIGDKLPLILAHLGVVERTIRVGREDIIIAGVQNVFVRPEHRGRGLVDEILVASMEEARRRRIDVGLLFCLPVLEKIYLRNGWRTIPRRPTLATRATGERYLLDEKNIAMFHPLMRSDFPEGEIDLNGDDW